MAAEIIKRRIGRVAVVDIRGAFSGASVLRKKDVLARAFYPERSDALVLNLTDLTGLDLIGAKSIVESAKRMPDLPRVGVLGGTQEMVQILNQLDEDKRFQIFRDAETMIELLGKNFVEPRDPQTDRRKCVRLKTALPIQFETERDGRRMTFQAIAVNLSEDGLFAEYLDLDTAARSLEHLNPYEGNRVHLSLPLANGKRVDADGQVIHRKLDGEQAGIGIRFVNLGDQEREFIRRFLNGM